MASKKSLSLLAILALLAVLTLSTFAAQTRAAVSWQVTITASLSDYSSTTILGVASNATDGFDTAYDTITPPEPVIGVTSYFYYPGNPSAPADQRKLSTSIIPESPNMTWTLRVVTKGLTGSMQLSWTSIPSQYSGYLKDSSETTVLAEMDAASQYTYSAQEDILLVFQVNLVPSPTPSPVPSSTPSPTTTPSPVPPASPSPSPSASPFPPSYPSESPSPAPEPVGEPFLSIETLVVISGVIIVAVVGLTIAALRKRRK